MGGEDEVGLSITGTGAVRTVTLNRPAQLNAIDVPLHRRLTSVWSELRRDRTVRAVVLTGAGRAFCAGGDMSLLEFATLGDEERHETVEDARRIVQELLAFPLPIVAAVNGPAVGLGCSLAMFCDVVLMSTNAYFADPHVTVGLVAADGGVLTWPALTSLLWAKEYILTGDRIDSTAALRMGLANHVVDEKELLTRAYELAERLAAQPRQALRRDQASLEHSPFAFRYQRAGLRVGGRERIVF